MKILAIILAFVFLAGVAHADADFVVSERSYEMPNQMLSKHFSTREFSCKCCGTMLVNAKLITKLEALREAIGDRPIVVTSGYRCPAHNKEVGGVDNSQHCLGKAADIYVNGMNNRELARYAKQVGFSFIKVYSGWIHVDVR